MKNIVVPGLLLVTACTSKSVRAITMLNKIAQTGEITNLHTGESLTARELLIILGKQQRVIVGEQHDNIVHHQIEHWLIEELPTQRPQGSLLLEMINPDQQVKVD